eukprot:gene12134-8355_t
MVSPKTAALQLMRYISALPKSGEGTDTETLQHLIVTERADLHHHIPAWPQPILHTIVSKGLVDCLRCCMESPMRLDFTQTEGVLGRTVFHLLCHYQIPQKKAVEMLRLLIFRIETHPIDTVDWGQRTHRQHRYCRNDRGFDFLSYAALHGRLAIYWPKVRHMAFYGDATDPLDLCGWVWEWDWEQLNQADGERESEGKPSIEFMDAEEPCDNDREQQNFQRPEKVVRANHATVGLLRLCTEMDWGETTQCNNNNSSRGSGETSETSLCCSASASSSRFLDYLQQCVTAGACVTFAAPFMDRPFLHEFIRQGRFDCAAACLDMNTLAPVDFTVKDKGGRTVLDTLCMCGMPVLRWEGWSEYPNTDRPRYPADPEQVAVIQQQEASFLAHVGWYASMQPACRMDWETTSRYRCDWISLVAAYGNFSSRHLTRYCCLCALDVDRQEKKSAKVEKEGTLLSLTRLSLSLPPIHISSDEAVVEEATAALMRACMAALAASTQPLARASSLSSASVPPAAVTAAPTPSSSLAAVGAAVEAGADIFYTAPHRMEDPILLSFARAGLVPLFLCCLERTPRRSLDFDTARGACGQTVLHYICAGDLPRTATRIMLSAFVHRVQAHPLDVVNWEAKDIFGKDALRVAAWAQRLSLYWSLVCDEAYFADATGPFSLAGCRVWQADWSTVANTGSFDLTGVEWVTASSATAKLCELSWQCRPWPAFAEVASAVEEGAEVCFHSCPGVAPPLHVFLKAGAVSNAQACLQTPAAIDFTVCDPLTGLPALHTIVVNRKTSAQVAELLQRLLERLHVRERCSSGTPDVLDWAQRSANGEDLFSLAASHGHLATLWRTLSASPVQLLHPSFGPLDNRGGGSSGEEGERPPPVHHRLILSRPVRKKDWHQLQPKEQDCFHLHSRRLQGLMLLNRVEGMFDFCLQKEEFHLSSPCKKNTFIIFSCFIFVWYASRDGSHWGGGGDMEGITLRNSSKEYHLSNFIFPSPAHLPPVACGHQGAASVAVINFTFVFFCLLVCLCVCVFVCLGRGEVLTTRKMKSVSINGLVRLLYAAEMIKFVLLFVVYGGETRRKILAFIRVHFVPRVSKVILIVVSYLSSNQRWERKEKKNFIYFSWSVPLTHLSLLKQYSSAMKLEKLLIGASMTTASNLIDQSQSATGGTSLGMVQASSTDIPPDVPSTTGYLRFSSRATLPPYALSSERPSAATPILMESLEAQRLNWSAFQLRAADASNERREKLLRLQSLRQQQTRREALNAQDAEGIQRTADMLEEVVVAVRERQTSLSPNGYQAFIFQNQDVYEGNWKNSRMHGKGVLRRAVSKDMYEGQWFLGQRSGQGMHHSSAFNTFYTGSWLENKRHGRGELLEPEGLYSGEFHDNNIHGYGEYVYHDGHVYRGEWVCGLYEGVGTYINPSGTKYEGGWRGGYEHGRGTRHYFNGDSYTGEWRYGLPHGVGTYTSVRFQYEGDWRYGTVQGRGVCRYADGSRYDGEWINGKFNGLGTFSSAGRRITYMGEFKAGKREGRGEYNGLFVYYNGDWKNDKKHGVGTAKIRECGYYHGMWRDDFPEGRGTYRLWDEEMVWFENGICVKIEEMSQFRIVGMKMAGADSRTLVPKIGVTRKRHMSHGSGRGAAEGATGGTGSTEGSATIPTEEEDDGDDSSASANNVVSEGILLHLPAPGGSSDSNSKPTSGGGTDRSGVVQNNATDGLNSLAETQQQQQQQQQQKGLLYRGGGGVQVDAPPPRKTPTRVSGHPHYRTSQGSGGGGGGGGASIDPGSVVDYGSCDTGNASASPPSTTIVSQGSPNPTLLLPTSGSSHSMHNNASAMSNSSSGRFRRYSVAYVFVFYSHAHYQPHRVMQS